MNVNIVIAIGLAFPLMAACGSGSSQPADASKASTSTAQAPAAAAAGPIDVCGIVTAADAAALLGSLAPQPPAKTDHAGFGVDDCLYIGPALSGAGAQTRFARLTVQAGRSRDASDMLQADVDRRKATEAMPGVGESAKRSADGSFVWATKGGVTCTGEISGGLPPTLTADSAAKGLGDLCGKVFGAVGH